MAKKIKTTRYWTRKCSNCSFEYPNWFTVCPKCHVAWNGQSTDASSGTAQVKTSQVPPVEQEKEKTIKIIAQLTEENVKITKLTLFFSADNGISWFQMDMNRETDYFAADILNVPINSTIVYYLKVIDENGLEFIEDNNQNYYYYHVSEVMESEIPESMPPATKPTDTPAPYMSQSSAMESLPPSTNITENDMYIPPVPPKKEPLTSSSTQDTQQKPQGVVFTPLDQVQRDDNLKLCPNCQSKIKADWGICPICGSPQPN